MTGRHRLTYVSWMTELEPLRLRMYGALVALLPLLVAFGVDLTEPQTAAITAFAYVVLVSATEASRAKVSPVR